MFHPDGMTGTADDNEVRTYHTKCPFVYAMSMIPPWLSLLMTAMAVVRATRVITTDAVALPLRRWVQQRSGDTGWFTFLIHCKYCTSVWIAAAAAPLWWFFHNDAGFLIPVIAGAFAQFLVYLAKPDDN